MTGVLTLCRSHASRCCPWMAAQQTRPTVGALSEGRLVRLPEDITSLRDRRRERTPSQDSSINDGQRIGDTSCSDLCLPTRGVSASVSRTVPHSRHWSPYCRSDLFRASFVSSTHHFLLHHRARQMKSRYCCRYLLASAEIGRVKAAGCRVGAQRSSRARPCRT